MFIILETYYFYLLYINFFLYYNNSNQNSFNIFDEIKIIYLRFNESPISEDMVKSVK